MGSLRGAVVAFLLVAAGATPGGAAEAVYFLLDTSGSLTAQDLARGRDIVLRHLASRDSDDLVGVISFDDRPVVVAPLRRDRAAVQQALGTLAIHGRHTALNDALYDAALALGATGAERRAIVLLSDGKDEDSALLFADAQAAIERNQVVVFAVGIGAHRDEKFLRRLGKLSRGEYFSSDVLADPALLMRRVEELLLAVPAVRVTAVSGSAAPTPPAPTPGLAGAAAPTAKIEATVRSTKHPMAATPTTAAPVAQDKPPPGGGVMPTPLLLIGIGALGLILIGLYVGRRRRLSPESAPLQGGETEPPLPSRTLSLSQPGSDRDEMFGETTAADSFSEEVPAPLPKAAPPVDEGFGELDPMSSTVRLSEPIDSESEVMPIAGEQLDRTFMLADKPVLNVRRGRNVGESYLVRLNGETYLGRGQVNEVALGDISVSGRHAKIVGEGKIYTLTDLHSSNGTFVNDRRIEGGVAEPLREGDVIRLGETELVFKVEQRRA